MGTTSITEEKEMETINPATKEKLGALRIINEKEINQKIESAEQAQKVWRKTSAPNRGDVLLELATLIEQEKEGLTQLLVDEAGKCTAQAAGEVDRTTSILRFLAGEGARLTGTTIPSTDINIMAYSVQRPLGVVGIITPWNVPLAIPVWKIAPALVAGNAVVWKPAPQTILIAEKLQEIFDASSLPEGLVQMVIAPGPEVGKKFAEHETIKAVSFTGSTDTGRIINQMVAPRGIRFQAEMGGKNPFIIMPDANLERAAADVIAGGLLDGGQRCTATSRIFVHQSVHQAFRKELTKQLANVRVGNPHDALSIMGPVVDEQQYRTVRSYIQSGIDEQLDLAFGGLPPAVEENKGYFIQPTLFDHVTQESKLAQEEIFGPVLVMIPFDDFDACLEQANDIRYGLSSSIYTQNIDWALQYVEEIESGLVHINLPSAYSEPQMPFGGIKATGIGGFRELGQHAVSFYTEWKTIYARK
ncbi:aldehyde dehydrogenase family protein [Gracilibacillus salinarum]|uniref:Aldehyde dehydrogenase family protein n=1 Tax=Gracilibacillus salinarum TaxID=2932255 RepID=A0ABY4GKX6_9BACI|nr:aldehyde dehydrogenase family protein [Gracilibacillus salinarum]UOQ84869.1 aldehyde dehydrogenase family protein [Gracilibacillus salinarum]